MTFYDDKLNTLSQQVARKKQLQSILQELMIQKETLEEKVAELEKSKNAEQKDVDKLEKVSLSAMLYTIVGKKDEKIEKEKAEAYAARVKYETALGELSHVNFHMEKYESELNGLRDCEKTYQEVLSEKADAIKKTGSTDALKILHLEGEIAGIKNEQKEILEANDAGRKAYSITEDIMASLNSAHGWGTYDLIGGGFISDMAKHGHLDDAQAGVEQLQKALGRFKTELADVTIQANMKINIDGFLKFADYFFDGIFADWTVQDRINNAISQVQQTQNQIEKVLGQLKAMNNICQEKQMNMEKELEELVKKG